MEQEEIIEDFCYAVKRDKEKYNDYIKLCKELNIPTRDWWNGNGTYYGIRYNTAECRTESYGLRCHTLDQVREHINKCRASALYKIY